MTAYRLSEAPEGTGAPDIVIDTTGGTTSWRDAKKALRQWYVDKAKELRTVTEKNYFSEGNRSD